jgi:signal transduction histidine kinase
MYYIKYNGKIWAENNRDGKGSTFFFRLPSDIISRINSKHMVINTTIHR